MTSSGLNVTTHSSRDAMSALSRKIAAGWAQLFSSAMAASLLNFLSFILLTRSVPVAMVGIVAVTQTYWRLIEGFLGFRSFNVLISYGAEALAKNDRHDFQRIVSTCFTADLVITVAGASIGIAGLLLFYGALNIPPDFLYFAIVASLLMLRTATGAPYGILRLNDKYRYIAICEFLVALARGVLSVVGFLAELPAAYFLCAWVGAQALGDLALIALSDVYLRQQGFRYWDREVPADRQRSMVLLRSLLAVNAASTIYLTAEEGDVLLVNQVLGPESAAKYKIAKNFAGIIQRVTNPLHDIIFPEISRLVASGNRVLFSNLVWKLNAACGLLAVVGVVAWIALGEFIIVHTVGEKFVDTTSTTTILMCGIALLFAGVSNYPTLLALQLWRAIFVLCLLSATTFFAAAMALIPHYGVNGAAIAQLLCYAIQVGGAFAIIHLATRWRTWAEA